MKHCKHILFSFSLVGHSLPHPTPFCQFLLTLGTRKLLIDSSYLLHKPVGYMLRIYSITVLDQTLMNKHTVTFI